MRKLFIAAAAGILLLGVLALGTILLFAGRDATRAPTPGEPPAAATVPPTLPPVSASVPALALPERRPEPPPPPLIQGPPPPRPEAGSWEAVPPAARPSAAGPAGAAIGRALNELQPRLSACFDEDVQARHGRESLTRTREDAPLEDHGTTILMLQVEVSPGEARIVDAPVETRGGASDGLIACAQRVLRGQVIPLQGSPSAERQRILFPLLQ
jgi:hypothetical protein